MFYTVGCNQGVYSLSWLCVGVSRVLFAGKRRRPLDGCLQKVCVCEIVHKKSFFHSFFHPLHIIIYNLLF